MCGAWTVLHCPVPSLIVADPGFSKVPGLPEESKTSTASCNWASVGVELVSLTRFTRFWAAFVCCGVMLGEEEAPVFSAASRKTGRWGFWTAAAAAWEPIVGWRNKLATDGALVKGIDVNMMGDLWITELERMAGVISNWVEELIGCGGATMGMIVSQECKFSCRWLESTCFWVYRCWNLPQLIRHSSSKRSWRLVAARPLQATGCLKAVLTLTLLHINFLKCSVLALPNFPKRTFLLWEQHIVDKKSGDHLWEQWPMVSFNKTSPKHY